jgi:hypothetical protein
MPANLIPALDSAPLPGPPWLFHVLWLLTFLIHLLFMNAVLGGTLLAAFAGRRSGGRETKLLLVEINSWAISLAVTFGIAPLLFVQVLFGRFFYTATVLVAWAWLGLVVLLTLAYYLNYIAKFRLRAGKGASVLLTIEAVLFLLIAAIQVAVNLLHLQPGRWQAVASRVWAALADPAFIPRYLHFVFGAVTMAAVLLAWLAVRRAARGGDETSCRAMAGYGVRAALVATIVQLADGFWLLLALPEDLLRSFMRTGALALAPLALGIAAAVALLAVLAQITDPVQQAGRVRRVSELIVVAMLFMVITRHELRTLYLEPARATEQVAVAPQWDVFALFLVVFLVCVGLTVYALVRAAKDRPAPGERSA